MSALTEYTLNERAIWAEQLRLFMMIEQQGDELSYEPHTIIRSCDFFDNEFLKKVIHRHYHAHLPMTAKQIKRFIQENLDIDDNNNMFGLSQQKNLTDDIVNKYNLFWHYFMGVMISSCPKVSLRSIKKISDKIWSPKSGYFENVINDHMINCNVNTSDTDIIPLTKFLNHPNVKWDDFFNIIDDLDVNEIKLFVCHNPNFDLKLYLDNTHYIGDYLEDIIKSGNVKYSEAQLHLDQKTIKNFSEYLQYDDFWQLDCHVSTTYRGKTDHMPTITKKEYLNYNGIHKSTMAKMMSIDNVIEAGVSLNDIKYYRPSQHLLKLKAKRKALLPQVKKHVGVQYYKYLYNPVDGVELKKSMK